MEHLRKVNVTRYIEPFKEGGSLPGLVEADDGFKYVIKFKGAGQGAKALVAELIGGLLARAIDLRVPELVVASLDESFGRTEPDQEIQDLLKASEGLNLGLHFLSGAFTFDAVVNKVDNLTASRIVWLDALIFNVDRTAKNTNLLVWNKELWAIDHGASLYFHHNWEQREKYILNPFTQIKDHVLLPYASEIEQVDRECKGILTRELIKAITDEIPGEWLINYDEQDDAMSIKNAYTYFLTERLQHSSIFLKEIMNARPR